MVEGVVGIKQRPPIGKMINIGYIYLAVAIGFIAGWLTCALFGGDR